MRIAIIGGGSAGLTTAYLLHRHHDVTVFESETFLGGNVRTLGSDGGNVPCERLPAGVRVEAGVTAYHAATYPVHLRLVSRLGVATRPHLLTVAMFLPDGTHMVLENAAFGASLSERRRLTATRLHRLETFRATNPDWLLDDTVRTRYPPVSHPLGRFQRYYALLSWSTPWDRVDELDASMGMALALDAMDPLWHIPEEGAFAPYAAMLERMDGRVRVSLGRPIAAVSRSADSVRVEPETGGAETFDHVVFATLPDAVPRILADASEDERRRFEVWGRNVFPTTAHEDPDLYRPWRDSPVGPTDFFVNEDGSAGYNTWMSKGSYGFAYGLDHRIASRHVLGRFEHHCPRYAARAVRRRHEIASRNGENRTFHAGAYLGSTGMGVGLQEGATCSALAVSRLLGGDEIP